MIAVQAGAWPVDRAVVHRHNGPPVPWKLSWSPYTNGSVSGGKLPAEHTYRVFMDN